MASTPLKMPSLVRNGYQRYKEEANLFFEWFHSVSQVHMPPEVLPRTSAELAVQHLVPMAEACANAGITVPDKQQTYFFFLVQMRRYAVFADDSDQVEDGHFFCRYLDEVGKLLAIETPSDSLSSLPIMNPAQSLPMPTKLRNVQVSLLLEDAHIEVFCFLEDVHLIRKYIQAVWKSYLARNLDLISAAFITQAAFELIMVLNNNLSCRHPTHSHHAGLLDVIFDKLTSAFSSTLVTLDAGPEGVYFVLPQSANQPGRQKRVRLDGFDSLREVLLHPAHALLVNLTANPSTPNQSADYQLLLNLKKRAVQLKPLVNCWQPDLLTVFLGKSFSQLSSTFLPAAMTSILLDLHKMEGLFSMAAKDFDRFSDKFPHDFYSIEPTDDKVSIEHKKGLAPMLAWLKSDATFKGKDMVSLNPVFAGITLFAAFQRVQSGIVNSTSHQWALLPMAHIYNHGRVLGQWRREWPDMEAVIRMQTAEIFVSGRPTNASQCETRFWLANGGKMPHLVHLRGRKASIQAEMKSLSFPRDASFCRDKIKAMKGGSAVVARRIASRKNTPGYRRELLPTPVLFSMYNRGFYERKNVFIVVEETSPKIKKVVDDYYRELGGTPVQTSHLHIDRYLDCLLALAQCEMPHMFFDYMSLFHRCCNVPIIDRYLNEGKSTFGDDIDDGVWIDMFFSAKNCESVGRMVETREFFQTTISKDWKKFCKDMALHPCDAKGWDEKYRVALAPRATRWTQESSSP